MSNVLHRRHGRNSSKSARRAVIAASAAVALVGGSKAALADTFGNLWSSDGNQTNLNSSSAWLDETVGGSDPAPPGSNDIAQFDNNTGLSSLMTFTLGES